MKCDLSKGNSICSEELLPIIVKVFVEDERVTIKKIVRCDKGGYHLWIEVEDL